MAALMEKGHHHILKRLDYSLFRPDVPPDKIQDIIFWVAEGYSNQLLRRLQGTAGLQELDMDACMQEFDGYLDSLRQCFYRSAGPAPGKVLDHGRTSGR
jgi:hypothetical protein